MCSMYIYLLYYQIEVHPPSRTFYPQEKVDLYSLTRHPRSFLTALNDYKKLYYLILVIMYVFYVYLFIAIQKNNDTNKNISHF